MLLMFKYIITIYIISSMSLSLINIINFIWYENSLKYKRTLPTQKTKYNTDFILKYNKEIPMNRLLKVRLKI